MGVSLAPRAASTNRLDFLGFLSSFPGVCGQKPHPAERQGEAAGGAAAARRPRHVVSGHRAAGQRLPSDVRSRPRFPSPPSRPVFSSPGQLDAKTAEIWSPNPATVAGLGPEEEILVTELGLHSLSGEGGVPLGSGVGGGGRLIPKLANERLFPPSSLQTLSPAPPSWLWGSRRRCCCTSTGR